MVRVIHQRVLTPTDPAWPAFIRNLTSPLACSFEGRKRLKWRCFGDFRFSERIIRRLSRRIHVRKTLEFFRDHGAYCDCEVVFNLVQRRGGV